MTERGKATLRRSSHQLDIGPSKLTWDADTLHISVREWAAPLPRRIEGDIEIRLEAAPSPSYTLDTAGRHRWFPISPIARAYVRMKSPDSVWSGQAYIDSNIGEEPLADGFRDWSWSRTIEQGQTRVFYDATRLDGSALQLALAFSDGVVVPIAAPPKARIGCTNWRLPLEVRSDAPQLARKLSSWEDGPFYARSLVDVQLDGERALAVHECLSLLRFDRRWVQTLLPFRMPRRISWKG
jgi:carotenoid 1,2-hydratase